VRGTGDCGWACRHRPVAAKVPGSLPSASRAAWQSAPPAMAAWKMMVFACSFRLRSCLVDGVRMNALVAREAKLKLARSDSVCGLFCASDTQACQAVGQQRRDLVATLFRRHPL